MVELPSCAMKENTLGEREFPPPPLEQALPRCWLCKCGKTFPSSTRYYKHVALHSEIRAFRCTFPGCNRSFKRNTHLKRHLAQHKTERHTPAAFQVAANLLQLARSFSSMVRFMTVSLVTLVASDFGRGLNCKCIAVHMKLQMARTDLYVQSVVWR